MDMSILVFQEVRKCPTHATVVTFKDKIILDLKQISPCLIASLLGVTTVGTPEIIQVCLLATEEIQARGY